MKHTVEDVLLVLVAAFPYKELPDETINLYVTMLRDIDPALLQAAALQYISEDNTYFPTIGQLRAKALDMLMTTTGHVDPEQAWGLVVRHIRLYGGSGASTGLENRLNYLEDVAAQYGEPFDRDAKRRELGLPPMVQQAVDDIGGLRVIQGSDNIAADRARFIQAYQARHARQVSDNLMLPQVRQMLAQAADKLRGKTNELSSNVQ